MYLVIAEGSEEFSRLKLTLGRGIKQIRDRREMSEALNRDSQDLYNLVIVGSTFDLASVLSLSEELRVSHPTIGVILLRKKLEPSIVTQALSSGIRDVVLANDPEGIVLACKKSEDISRRQLQNSTRKNDPVNLGKVIVMHGARDGVGVTTAAINIATDLVHRKKLKVCLVDACAIMGDIAVRFRVESTKSWMDLIGLIDIDEEAIHSTVHVANSGIELLLAPREVDLRLVDENAFINQIIRALQRKYEYIIIDTDSRLNDMTKGIFSIAHQVILFSDLDLASLKNLKIRLKEIVSADISESAISLFINQSDLKVGINPKDIPELIGINVSIFLPWDSEVTRFGNEGLAIVSEKVRSGLSHEFLHASDALLDSQESPQNEKSKSRSRKSA
jgi:pilus assembly protein CpaE